MDSKYRNPFTLRASEKIAEDDVFLRLFSPEALKQLEDEHKNSDLWNNVIFMLLGFRVRSPRLLPEVVDKYQIFS